MESSVQAMTVAMSIILIIVLFIPLAIAYQKGRGSILWWFYSPMLWPIALLHAVCLSPSEEAKEKALLAQGMIKCSACAELVKKDAKVCKHCGAKFNE